MAYVSFALAPASAIGQVREAESEAEALVQPIATVRTNGSALAAGSKQPGERQSREKVALEAGIEPMARINNRIANRVQSRVHNRIDQRYDPGASPNAAFRAAEDQLSRPNRPRR